MKSAGRKILLDGYSFQLYLTEKLCVYKNVAGKFLGIIQPKLLNENKRLNLFYCGGK